MDSLLEKLSMPDEIECYNLTKEFMESNWKQLYDIDTAHVSNGYIEFWDIDNYMFELKDKWTLSSYVCMNSNILGYRIVSGQGKFLNYAHSHRTSIKPEFLRQGIAKRLLERSISNAKILYYIGFTGLVHKNNAISKKFLKNTGWKYSNRMLNNNELWFLEFN